MSRQSGIGLIAALALLLISTLWLGGGQGGLAPATAAPAAAPLGNLRFITPVRVVDTRATSGGIVTTGFDPANPSVTISPGPISANGTRRFLISSKTFSGFAFPGDVTGVLLNVTTIQGAGSGGFVTVFPGDVATVPNASTVNPSTAIAANFWSTGVPTVGQNAGSIAVFSTNTLDLAVDVVGFFAPSNPATVGNLQFITPVRVLDTRPSFGGVVTTGFDVANPNVTISATPLAANSTHRFLVSGKTFSGFAFPADVSGIIAHVTTVQGAGTGGFVTLFPGSATTAPNASTVNPSTAIAFNSWATGIAAPTDPNPGSFGVFSTNTLDLAVDVVGYYAPSAPATIGGLTFITPSRVVDTRGASVGGPIGFNPDGSAITVGQLTAGGTRRFLLSGKSFAGTLLPTDVQGVLANVTIVQNAPSGGFVTAFPGDVTAAPNVSTVNPSTAIAASFWANGVPTAGTSAGTEAVFSTNQLDLVIDVVGYFNLTGPPVQPTPTPTRTATPTQMPQTLTVAVGPSGTLSYSPANQPIHQGDTVNWVWSSMVIPHSVTSGNCVGSSCTPDGRFDSGQHTAPFNFMASAQFTANGVYHYYCSVHGANMQGTITVQ